MKTNQWIILINLLVICTASAQDYDYEEEMQNTEETEKTTADVSIIVQMQNSGMFNVSENTTQHQDDVTTPTPTPAPTSTISLNEPTEAKPFDLVTTLEPNLVVNGAVDAQAYEDEAEEDVTIDPFKQQAICEIFGTCVKEPNQNDVKTPTPTSTSTSTISLIVPTEAKQINLETTSEINSLVNGAANAQDNEANVEETTLDPTKQMLICEIFGSCVEEANQDVVTTPKIQSSGIFHFSGNTNENQDDVTTPSPTPTPTSTISLIEPTEAKPIDLETTSQFIKQILIDMPTSTEQSNQIAVKPIRCGYRRVGGLDIRARTASIDEAGFGEFPWMVAILTSNGSSVGGGSLIHPKVVLTVYHNMRRFESNPRSLKVRAGEWDTRTTTERLPHQERIVSRIFRHPQYTEPSYAHDIAVIELDEAFVLDDHIGTICLPPSGHVPYQQDCIATAWGKNAFESTTEKSIILKQIPLGIVEFQRCQEILQTTRLGRRFHLDPSFICAGGIAGVDTCKGDGGAPLVCPVDNRYAQNGIVAWGIGCQRAIPGAYTNVAMARQWIDETMRSIGLDTSSYTFSQ